MGRAIGYSEPMLSVGWSDPSAQKNAVRLPPDGVGEAMTGVGRGPHAMRQERSHGRVAVAYFFSGKILATSPRIFSISLSVISLAFA